MRERETKHIACESFEPSMHCEQGQEAHGSGLAQPVLS